MRHALAIKVLPSRKLEPRLRVASADLAMRMVGDAVYERDVRSSSAMLRDAKKLIGPLKLAGFEAELAALKRITDGAKRLARTAKRARAKLAKTSGHLPSQQAIALADRYLVRVE